MQRRKQNNRLLEILNMVAHGKELAAARPIIYITSTAEISAKTKVRLNKASFGSRPCTAYLLKWQTQMT